MVVDGKWGYGVEDWNNVADQYSELSKDGNVTQIFKLRKDIKVLEYKCSIIEMTINSLDIADYAPLWTILRRLSITGKTLDSCKTQAKRYVHELVELNKELAKFVSDKKTTRADFDDRLVILGKYLGYPIKENETTLAKYCAISNKYNEEQEAIKRQSEKSNGRRFN